MATQSFIFLSTITDDFQKCFTCDSEVDPECLNLDPQVDHGLAGYCKDYLDRCASYVIRKFCF